MSDRHPTEIKGEAVLYVRIAPELIEHVDRARQAVGVSRKRYVSELLRKDMLTVDTNGVPYWWSRDPRQPALHFDDN